MPPETYASVLGSASLIPVPIPADCRDGFEAAYWHRPEAILDPVVWRASSALSMISDADRSAGLSRLAADLASGDMVIFSPSTSLTSATAFSWRVKISSHTSDMAHWAAWRTPG